MQILRKTVNEWKQVLFIVSGFSRMLLTIFKLMSKKFPWIKAFVIVILCKFLRRFFYGTENKCFNPFWTTLYLWCKTGNYLETSFGPSKHIFQAAVGRHPNHRPGSQPLFSLIPDPGQNKADTSIISAVIYGAYIPLSRPIQFCPLFSQNFEKNVKDPADPAEP